MFKIRLPSAKSAGATVLLLSLLAACGGAPADASDKPTTPTTPTTPIPSIMAMTPREVAAPHAVGDTATDGLNWINFRRRQAGLDVLARNGKLDFAALGQSTYLLDNQALTHVQTLGRPGFTGTTLTERLAASGYDFLRADHVSSEVIASTSSNSGFNAADELITAIYHRFVVLEPMAKLAGVAAVTNSNGTFFTADTTADGLDHGLGVGHFVTYPAQAQTLVPTLFHSDGEKPDPVPGRHDVGYPVSVHADLLSALQVQRFSLHERGGAPLPVQLLTNATDPNTPTSAAAIIPLAVLRPATTYEVQFAGRVDGVPVARNWQFTTQ